ncbi:unnamed protein product [Orchesella dallaii]|uniref:BTB domain-containing protein n=1 Tax=Orchesella dallaii TaxID=48710 RepID=A0ABP1RY46_9HEXA
MSLCFIKQKAFMAKTNHRITPTEIPYTRWTVRLSMACMLNSLIGNSKLMQSNLWPKLEAFLQKKWCQDIYVRFRKQLYVSAGFLEEFSKEVRVMLEMTIEFEDKTWNFDFNINTRGRGVARKNIAPEEDSEFRQAIYSGKAKITIELIFGEIKQTHPTETKFPLQPSQSAIFARKLLEKQIQSDVQLVSQNGEMFPCHKSFLAGQSSRFHQLFEKRPEKKFWKFDMTEEGLSAFLKYIYYADIEEPKKNLKIGMELLKIGREYNITSLEKCMMDLMLEVPASTLTVEIALELFCFTRKEKEFEDLRKKVIKLMKWNSVKVSESRRLRRIVGRNDDDAIKELDSIGLYK